MSENQCFVMKMLKILFRNQFQHRSLVGGKASGVKWDQAPQNPTVHVCVCVWWMHVYLHVHVCLHVCMSIRVCVCVCVCVYMYMGVDESACVVCMSVCVCVSTPASL